MKPKSTLRSFLALAGSSLLAISYSHAANIWDGLGADNNWSTVDNWDDNALPGTTALTFTGDVQTSTNNDLTAALSYAGINFTNDGSAGKTSAFTLAGASSITLGGNINMTAPTAGSTITDLISLDVILSAQRVINTAQQNATVQHNLTISGLISASAANSGITKGGANSTLTLSNSGNSFTGNISINNGTVSVNSVSDYNVVSTIGASTTGPIILGGTSNGNGTLECTGSGGSTNRQFQIGQAGTANSATGNILNNGSGALTFTALQFNIPATVVSIALNTRKLTLGGSYTGGINKIQGTIVANVDEANRPVSITKTGASSWQLDGTNTYTGLTNIQGGTLIAGSNAPSGAAGAFGNASSEMSLGVAGGSDNAGILIGGAFTVGRKVRLATSNTTDAGTRVLTLGGNTAHNSEFSGNIFLGTASQAGRGVTLTAANGGQVTFSGLIQEPGSMDATTYTVTKEGLGTVVLSNANTYTGATTVSAGTLTVNGSLADASMSIASGAVVNGTGTLTFNIDGITGDQVVNGGTINVSGLTVAVNATGAGLTQASYVLVDATGGGSISGVFAGLTGASGYALDYGTANQVKLVQTGGITFANWKTANSAGAQTLADDHDGDGVDNGTEFFLGGDTITTGFTALPPVVNTGGTLSVTWAKHPNYPGAYNTDFVVETSDTLIGAWTTEPTPPSTVTISGNNVTYTFPNPLGTKKFARLKVTGP